MAYPLTTGVILAGGQSRRLGVDKTRLTLHRGEPLLAQVGRVVASLCAELIVVANRAQPEVLAEATWLPDEHPGMGSLSGIYTGVLHASHEHCLVVAGDMPFLSPTLLRYILEQPRDYDVLIPRFDGFFEPLHAIYGKGCLGPMRTLIERGEQRILDFFPEVRIRYVDAEVMQRIEPLRRSFLNINTIEQLAEAWVMRFRDEAGSPP
jgi:molybdopterin-guanine dinucleotide biosynthesis protein A